VVAAQLLISWSHHEHLLLSQQAGVATTD